MKYGVVMFPTDYSIDPVSLGKEVEERGFDSLFFPEHTPSRRAGARPGPAARPCRRSTRTPTTRSSR
jgi:hypothetical protein